MSPGFYVINELGQFADAKFYTVEMTSKRPTCILVDVLFLSYDIRRKSVKLYRTFYLSHCYSIAWDRL